jgi:hypothetical protein
VLERAYEFVPPAKMESSRNLVTFLFQNEDRYLTPDGVNIAAVLTTLKDNNLLQLSFNQPQELELVFSTAQSPLVFMRSVTEALNALGYNLFLTKSMHKEGGNFTWSISLSTQNVPNPLNLSAELSSRGCEVLDIRKSADRWSYTIDSRNARIDAILLARGKKTELKKPFAPYILSVNGGIRRISVETHGADHWYPKVSFYDEALHLLGQDDIDRRQLSYIAKVPSGAAYIKLDDRYTLDNIKRGLRVTLE